MQYILCNTFYEIHSIRCIIEILFIIHFDKKEHEQFKARNIKKNENNTCIARYRAPIPAKNDNQIALYLGWGGKALNPHVETCTYPYKNENNHIGFLQVLVSLLNQISRQVFLRYCQTITTKTYVAKLVLLLLTGTTRVKRVLTGTERDQQAEVQKVVAPRSLVPRKNLSWQK
jgi:hypothetical protein